MLRELEPEVARQLVAEKFHEIADDASRQDFALPDGWIYLGTNDCVCAFAPVNSVTWEVHVAARFRARAGEVLREAIAEMGRRGARKVVASPPVYNLRAIRCGLRAGMRVEGIRERSFPRGGVLHDQILLGVSI